MNGFSHGSISISPIYIKYTAYAHAIALDLFEENGVRDRGRRALSPTDRFAAVAVGSGRSQSGLFVQYSESDTLVVHLMNADTPELAIDVAYQEVVVPLSADLLERTHQVSSEQVAGGLAVVGG